MQSMPATAASKEFGRLLEVVKSEPVLITRHDRPIAVAVSAEEWGKLVSLLIESGAGELVADFTEDRILDLVDAAWVRRRARALARRKAR